MQQLQTSFGHYFASVVDDIAGVYQPQEDLETNISQLAFRTVAIAAVTLIVLTIIAVLIKDRVPQLKMPVFVLMTITMVTSTFILIGSTVYLNVNSDSGGPIHWHADFEIWACDNELELRDPTGFLSNKIGTSVLHEHDDHRIHLEGVAVDKEIDASLGKFFHVIGGAITQEAIVVPLNEEPSLTFEDEVDGDGPAAPNPTYVEPYIINDGENGRVFYAQDGQTCGQNEADVQVFVYSLNEGGETYEQRKLQNPRDYTIFEDSNVPPGDCIIFEFDVPKEKTDKLCEQYGVRDIDRCQEFGVEPDQREICELEQLNYEQGVDYTIEPLPLFDIDAGTEDDNAAGTQLEGTGGDFDDTPQDQQGPNLEEEPDA